MYPLLIIAVIIFAGLATIFLLSNQTTQTSPNLNLNPTNSPTNSVPTPTIVQSLGQSASGSGFTTFPDGLKIKDLRVGTGQEVKSGDTVTVNYIGTLSDGTKFDSSYDRNQPFTTKIGVGQVIKGWDEGIVGMKVGGKRELIIPPSLGYGDTPQGSIPPNSTLIFQVELLGIQ